MAQAGRGPEVSGGRKPWDALVMFKAIVLCALFGRTGGRVRT